MTDKSLNNEDKKLCQDSEQNIGHYTKKQRTNAGRLNIKLRDVLAPALYDNTVPPSVTGVYVIADNCEADHFNPSLSLSHVVFVLITR